MLSVQHIHTPKLFPLSHTFFPLACRSQTGCLKISPVSRLHMDQLHMDQLPKSIAQGSIAQGSIAWIHCLDTLPRLHME
jgi:hypothetical protein